MDSVNLPDKAASKNLHDYAELIETIARIEYNRLSSSAHLIDFSELVNIGSIAVHVIFSSQENCEYNTSYISTAIKWAIRNELRRRYKWYSNKYRAEEDHEMFEQATEKELEVDKGRVREAIYETILSIEELSEAENPVQIRDTSFTPDELLEFSEMSKAIKRAISKLPPREKMIIESRFFKNKKIKDIAEELEISSSRISRIIQTALDRVKKDLIRHEML